MKALMIPLLALALLFPCAPAFAQALSDEEQITELTAQKDKAIARVKVIVNQPVTHVPRSSWALIQIFSPGWFHPGAHVPDFDTVDVRATQEFPYAKFHFVSSDLNPTEMFLGSELEFNAMTKLFYMDRTVPKKRLTEKEMLEINQLYRVIGRCLIKLSDLQNPPALTYITSTRFLNSPYGVASQLMLLLGASIILYRLFFRPR